jgi:hypothetical protein
MHDGALGHTADKEISHMGDEGGDTHSPMETWNFRLVLMYGCKSARYYYGYRSVISAGPCAVCSRLPNLTSTLSNQPELQRRANAELRTKIINNFKEVRRQCQEIDTRIELVKSFLESEPQHLIKKADRPNNLDSSHET